LNKQNYLNFFFEIFFWVQKFTGYTARALGCLGAMFMGMNEERGIKALGRASLLLSVVSLKTQPDAK
jgi:hypothetical protein